MNERSAPTGRVTRSQAKIAALSLSTDPGETYSTPDPPSRPIRQSNDARRAEESVPEPPSATAPTPGTPEHRDADDAPALARIHPALALDRLAFAPIPSAPAPIPSSPTPTPPAPAPDSPVNSSSRRCFHRPHPFHAHIVPQACPRCEMEKRVLTVIHTGLQVKKLVDEAARKRRQHNAQRAAQDPPRHPDDTWEDKWIRAPKGSIERAYRRARSSLNNLVDELEDLRMSEEAWEEGRIPHPVELSDYLLDGRLGSAARALAYLRRNIDQGTVGDIELDSAARGRKRARQIELAKELDFPGYHDMSKLTQEQRAFISTDVDTRPDELSAPRSKRHKSTPTDVDFDAYIYTRRDSDIDALFPHPLPPIPLPPSPLQRPALRNPASPGPAAAPRRLDARMHPPPSRPYTWTSLNMLELQDARWKRRRPRASAGYDTVNTSGSELLWDDWDAYTRLLEWEGEREDETGPGEQVRGEVRVRRRREIIEQVREEIEDEGIEQQWGREMRGRRGRRARFRPHGGVASVFALGSYVSAKAVGVVRRWGWF